MPYVKADPEMYDEIVSELGVEGLPGGRPSGDFQYEPAEAQFTPEELGPTARLLFNALLEAGATAFRVRYDGGYDEGFAHADALRFGDRNRPAQDVIQEISTPGLIAKLSVPPYAYGQLPKDMGVRYALDELAHELASRLLGDGYGTGEYQLYGEFTADLKTGRITDLKDVEQPRNMDLE